MEVRVAKRDDGTIAVVTRNVEGWAYGHLLSPTGTMIETPLPLASILSRGNWERLPLAAPVQITPEDQVK